MSKQIIGRCSHCNGFVTVPDVWFGIYPPVPTCESCGARKKDNLPVIDMDPPKVPRKPIWIVSEREDPIFKLPPANHWDEQVTITWRNRDSICRI